MEENNKNAKPTPLVVAAPVQQQNGTYLVPEPIPLGTRFTFACSKCGLKIASTAKEEGKKCCKCPKCGCTIIMNVGQKPEPKAALPTVAIKSLETNKAMGSLVYGGFLGFNRKVVKLHEGDNTIGRTDVEKPSTISFDDSYMSRQSAVIRVINDEDNIGYLFKFEVLNAANPVLVNKKELRIGDSLYLNFGDTLRMGRTRMRFVEAKK